MSIEQLVSILKAGGIFFTSVSLIVFLTGQLCVAPLGIFTDISYCGINKKNNKECGIIIFSLLITEIFLMLYKEIASWYDTKVIITIAIIMFIGRRCYSKESKKVIVNVDCFTPNKWKRDGAISAFFILVLVINSLNIYNSIQVYQDNPQKYIMIGIVIKLVIYYFFIITSCSYIFGIGIINDFKPVMLIGKDLKDLINITNGIDDITISGYLIGETKETIVFKPYNCNMINIKKEKIECIQYIEEI